MNLNLASRGGFHNPKSWSGTPYALKNELEKAFGTVVPAFDWQINKNILRLYYKIYSRFFFIWGTCRDPLLHPFFKQRISSLVKHLQNPGAWFLFISDYCIPDSISGKFRYAAYIDAFLLELLEHTDDKRLLRRRFVLYYERYNRKYLERMNLIYTQNEWTRQSIIRYYNISPGKIYNIGFGINVKLLKEEKNYEEELLLIVLRKGTEKYKGLLLLLEAFKLIKERRPGAQLAVVGTSVGKYQPGVTCYYNQPRSVTEELFRKATLYVMPALHEPNGITYLEALANKTPIVGLNRFAFPEFSGYGKWGFIVQKEDPTELAEVIISALNDKDKLNLMGTEGQKFVAERYRWNLVAEKILSTIRDFDIKETTADA